MFGEKGWFFSGSLRKQRQEKNGRNRREVKKQRERPSCCSVGTETGLVLADGNGQLFSLLEEEGSEVIR